jgi:hypothetical protein
MELVILLRYGVYPACTSFRERIAKSDRCRDMPSPRCVSCHRQKLCRAGERLEFDEDMPLKKLGARDPMGERIFGDGFAHSFAATKIGKNFRFPHAGIGFFETGDNGFHIGFARSSDYVILVAGRRYFF